MEITMAQTQDPVNGKLKQNNGAVNKQWGRLSNDEILKIKQKRATLVDKLKQK
jgi:uncharacterized protein YjbJ (UPF0337 family)